MCCSFIIEQSKSDFHIDYCVQWVVQLKGCVANKVITAWQQTLFIMSEAERETREATEWTNSASQQIRRWSRETQDSGNTSFIPLFRWDWVPLEVMDTQQITGRERKSTILTYYTWREHNYIPDLKALWFRDESLAQGVSERWSVAQTATGNLF